MKGLIAYEPIMADYFREFLLSSIDDGISYVEVRAPFFLQCVKFGASFSLLLTSC